MGNYLAQIKYACRYISDVKWKYFPALLGVGLGYSGMSITISLIPQVLIDAAVKCPPHTYPAGRVNLMPVYQYYIFRKSETGRTVCRSLQ